jgi:hypothetical protein
MLQLEDGGAAETHVVQLVGLDHFELAKELLKNRLKIVWIIKLRQAETEEQVGMYHAISALFAWTLFLSSNNCKGSFRGCVV